MISLSRIGNLLVIFVKFIFHNWFAKLLSFVAACLFYLNLQASKILVKNFEIPIEYPRLSSSFLYGKNNPKTCNVRVEGFKDLVNYHGQFLKFVIDQSELRVGENLIEVKKFWGASPKLKITPEIETIKVNVEHSYTKSVPVEVLFEGELSGNLVKTSHTIKPNTITLSGSKEILDSHSKWTIGKINLSNLRDSVTLPIRPADPPSGTAYIGIPREYSVRINILKVSSGTGEQIFAGVPLKCEGKNENLIATLSQDEVSIKFNSSASFSSVDIYQGIKATVPCNYTYDAKTKRILPNSYPASAKVRVTKSNLLKSIEIISVIPDKVTILYKVKTKEDDSRLGEDPAFDDILWPEYPKEDPRFQ